MKVVLKNHKTKMDWSWPPVVNFEVLPFAHFGLNLDEIQNGVSLPLVLSPLKISRLYVAYEGQNNPCIIS